MHIKQLKIKHLNMFNSESKLQKSTSGTDVNPNSSNRILAGTIIEGSIQTEGHIRIDGTLMGSITCKGKIVIGATGRVEGEIKCQNADVEGTIKANISVSELLSLKATAKLTGDIYANKLSIEPGATFTGTCSMGAIIKDLQHGNKSGESKRAEKTA